MPVAPDPPPGLIDGESPDPVAPEDAVVSSAGGIPLPGGGTARPMDGARPGAPVGPPTPPGADGTAEGTDRPMGLPAGDTEGTLGPAGEMDGGGALGPPGGGALICGPTAPGAGARGRALPVNHEWI